MNGRQYKGFWIRKESGSSLRVRAGRSRYHKDSQGTLRWVSGKNATVQTIHWSAYAMDSRPAEHFLSEDAVFLNPDFTESTLKELKETIDNASGG